jgi:predicted transposase/invertase (TIGR01784 family)
MRERIFNLISQDSISPQERARMKDEYSMEQLQQDKFEQGRVSEKQETARKMLVKGYDLAEIAELTGFSSEELAILSSTQG